LLLASGFDNPKLRKTMTQVQTSTIGYLLDA
jgi:hypothetical protein